MRLRIIDLRSDTVTVPTPAMREAMARAEVGDDVYGEDPTVIRLEEMAAARMGKEAGLFCASGTMANQVAVMTHTRRGDEVILEEEAHIYYYEAGALAVLSGVQPRLVKGRRGMIDPDDLARTIRPPNIHYPPARLLCLENTHNRAGGTVMTPALTRALAEVAHERGLAVHLDGARIFNAAAYLGCDPRELTAPVDSVMFCLSKGLGAPIGSVLCGSREFIERARRNRKIVGGGMRQAGVVAAAGVVALETMVDRLAEDHAHARLLADLLSEEPLFRVDRETVQTNIVLCWLTRGDAFEYVRRLAAHGVKVNATGPDRIRLVTHKDVSRADVEEAAAIMKEEARRFA
jgi:threonine aldolase